MVTETTSVTPKFTPESDKTAKKLEKLEAERGLLDPADRYKALVNAVEASLSVINSFKFRALERLYCGLTVMTVLLAVVIGTIALAHYAR